MSILGLVAYKRTGKDTLLSLLQTSPLSSFDPDVQTPVYWIIYANPCLSLSYVEGFLRQRRRRVGFADRLKENVHRELGLTEVTEQDKDNLYINGKLLRDYYIEEGARGRAIDPLYWVKSVLPFSLDDAVVVTDVRFPNELDHIEKFDCLTARLYRSQVSQPRADDLTERGLDQAETDLLLVTSEEEFNRALHLFPQYQGYKPVFVLSK
ncbi:Putative deoxynucleoside monophosphate kinase [Brazilian cedratvirus IHUMI]|uniref:Deoxynucleoside monophosphate kinase n=1 Tax=Brazilian cedratvirus IHUMI TaxID=2126980 RepID=A0A2R8FD41_9VIRU|nr:Putative deoxynucleoside monophosphate kinase [Brazilian cedratvirus IHUMI]